MRVHKKVSDRELAKELERKASQEPDEYKRHMLRQKAGIRKILAERKEEELRKKRRP